MTQTLSNQDIPWLTHYEKGVSADLTPETLTLPEFLERSASEFPDKTALNFQGYTLSYKELDAMVNQFSNALIKFGIKKGDSVSVLLPNVIPCVISYYAILRIGAIAVMNNPLYSDRELIHQFNDTGSKLLITLDLLADRMVSLRHKTAIKQIIYTSIGDYLPFPKSILFPLIGKKKGLAAKVTQTMDVYPWKSVLKESETAKPTINLSFEDIGMYQYTGGTTGVSKGVILTHKNICTNAQQVASWFPLYGKGNQKMIGALPFFHVFGMTVAMNWAIIRAWEIVLVPKPEPLALLDTINKFKPTIAPLVPTMFIGMLNHPAIDKTDMTSITGCFSGSAPLPVEVIKSFEEKTGAVIVEGFGLTESSPVTHINPFGDCMRKVGSIGIPLPGTQCKICDLEDKNKNADIGEPGELCIMGPQVMSGYKGLKKETDNTLVNGWLHTGDIATMDEDGYFYIVDRIKDMVISGGYNVYPREIDEVVYEHPKVAEACAIGVPHSTRGEQIKLFIVLKEGESAQEEDFIKFCSERLAKYKLPTEIEFRKELPKTNIGKILRKDLRQEELTRRVD